jgi:hypothetical protein
MPSKAKPKDAAAKPKLLSGVDEDDQLDEELVAGWIRQASELPGEPLF